MNVKLNAFLPREVIAGFNVSDRTQQEKCTLRFEDSVSAEWPEATRRGLTLPTENN